MGGAGGHRQAAGILQQTERRCDSSAVPHPGAHWSHILQRAQHPAAAARAGSAKWWLLPRAACCLASTIRAIELVTLANVCHQKFGRSRLRDILQDGVDPHSYVAAQFEGCSLDEFKQLPNRKELRQRAKAAEFWHSWRVVADTLVHMQRKPTACR